MLDPKGVARYAPLLRPGSFRNISAVVRRLGGEVVVFHRQNQVHQLEDTWPIGFSYL
jgi:hypothetical protein